ncbi:putative pentatricopeptide repeat-containing protein [Cinnamomum micranthum f. kanehirae]|uniref:Putative pentatricopeptide repeat-containing protein n=1 Tax=Cinnamomum micranthum f. kanehirae TaxID=337451 RepID=A0A3S3Q5I8_9MAGN|nr:putative pentatricopeptide repeat-containing protein [Cinnamomum micranthum f. kanehirae]
MLVFMRQIRHHIMHRRNSSQVSSFFSSPNPRKPLRSFSLFTKPSPLPSSMIMWFTSFICLIRFRFSTEAKSHQSVEDLDMERISRIVANELWDDPTIKSLFNSVLAPVMASRVLFSLRKDAPLALKFFNWAKNQMGCVHTTEAHCILVHILFRARMYFHAQSVCNSGFGVFDALFGVLIELDLLDEASDCFSKMRKFKIFTKARSCNALLHRLSKSGRGDMSKKLFKDMVAANIAPSVFTFNIMIDFVCKEGDLKTARGLFSQMKDMGCEPDVVTYNSLIDGHGKCGQLEEAECLLEEMKEAGCNPDVITYNVLINCFCKFEQLPKALAYLSEMKRSGVKTNVVTYSTFIDAFCKEGMMQEAIKFFVDMRVVGLTPNEFTYTSLIDGNCKAGNISEALKLVDEMTQAGVSLNIVTYTALVDGLCKEGKVEEAEVVFRAMVKAGVTANQLLLTALLHGFFKNRQTEKATNLWNEMREKDIKFDLSLYGTIIWGLCDQGQLEEAKLLISEMTKCGLKFNHVIYTSLMDAYFKAGKACEALVLFHEMIDSGIVPTVVTYCALVDGLCKAGSMEEAIYHFDRMKAMSLQPNVLAYTALIDGLCKNSCLEGAKKLFNEMLEKGMSPDRVAYTSLMDGNLKHGNLQEAFNLRDKMIENGIELDLHAYTSLIWGLCNCGQVQQARNLLDEMIGNGVLPDEAVYNCLIRKYCDLGIMDEVFELQNDMRQRGLITRSAALACIGSIFTRIQDMQATIVSVLPALFANRTVFNGGLPLPTAHFYNMRSSNGHTSCKGTPFKARTNSSAWLCNPMHAMHMIYARGFTAVHLFMHTALKLRAPHQQVIHTKKEAIPGVYLHSWRGLDRCSPEGEMVASDGTAVGVRLQQRAQFMIHSSHPQTWDSPNITPDLMGLRSSEWTGPLNRESKILFNIKLLNFEPLIKGLKASDWLQTAYLGRSHLDILIPPTVPLSLGVKATLGGAHGTPHIASGAWVKPELALILAESGLIKDGLLYEIELLVSGVLFHHCFFRQSPEIGFVPSLHQALF